MLTNRNALLTEIRCASIYDRWEKLWLLRREWTRQGAWPRSDRVESATERVESARERDHVEAAWKQRGSGVGEKEGNCDRDEVSLIFG